MNAAGLNRARGTRARGDNLNGYVIYHDTMVANWSNAKIELSTGGWVTPATKRRMNQASQIFGLGFLIVQRDFRFYAEYKGKTYQFHDNIVTLRRGL